MATPTFYLTTAIPYINGQPHLGHVLEWFQADAIAHYQRLMGKDVAFAAGSDENSLKNVRAAEKAGRSTQEWLDEYAEIFRAAYDFFGISLTHFRRSSDQELHWPGVQKLWELCNQSGDFYKKTYEGLYCVGCEQFYTPEELVDGKCPEHLTEPEKVKEENYFFRLSKYQAQIEKLIAGDTLQIISDQYRKEMLGFIQTGLEDFSVSRSVTRSRGVGVPVPNDPDQIMYVWFDALSVYMTAIGWGTDQTEWQKYWPADVHVIGKGINRFHSVYWIGMLLSAGLPVPKSISVHGYITSDGQKMGKALGNVIDPFALVKEYGLEPVRYFLLKEIPAHSDGDFNYDKFKESYTADLANGIGNLCSRVAKLCEKAELDAPAFTGVFDPQYQTWMDSYQTDLALKLVIQKVALLDGLLSEKKPWTLTGEEQKEVLLTAVSGIQSIAYHLKPFMPVTAQRILDHFTQLKISSLTPLFPRLAA